MAATVPPYNNLNFVNVSVDAEKNEGISIAEKYQVNVYPTLMFIATINY